MPRRPTYFFDTPRELQRVAYRARKSLGLCARCGKSSTPEGQCCATCLVEMASGKQEAQAQGMCVDCWTEPALQGKRCCAQHAAYRREQQRLQYGIRLVRKLCVKCGKKRAVKGRTMCREHLHASRRQRHAQIALRLNRHDRLTIEE